MNTKPAPWWQTVVLYQIYPRSFADSNGDGIGDIRGIIGRLDHLQWLGVDGIWLSPITVSPNADWGYDVADYCEVQPEYGTLADVDDLIAEASERGIRVLLDLVPNHTSDQHPWFKEHRDWYVWTDRPNNWVSMFGGSAWSLDEATGRYYLHNFAPGQPDLDWWNEEVRAAFDGIMRFWFDRGVAGFRIDVCHAVIKDAELRDNPPAEDDDHFIIRLLGQRQVYNCNRDEVHDVVRRWRKVADEYEPPRVLLGETVVNEVSALARFYGTGADELDLALNVPFQEAPFEADALRSVVAATEAALPPDAWPLWSASNHDISRMATRWAGGDPAKVQLALMLLLTLRGTPLLYYGDEIGLPDTVLSRDDLRDPVGLWLWPAHPGRDPARTPMPWDDSAGGGFTAAGITPWLPFGDMAACNVAAQRDDARSTLRFVRDLIALRRATPDLQTGARVNLPSPPGVWAWRRGEATIVALNFTDADVTVESFAGRLELAPWQGTVVHCGAQGTQRCTTVGERTA